MRGRVFGAVCMAGLLMKINVSAMPVEVKVEVTEVDHVKASSLGIQWINTASFRETQPAGLVSLGSIDRFSLLQADMRMLVEEGAAEILANPNLVTDSGTTASFHAGGEIPYVTNTALGSPHVEFKPYGVMLEIRPRVLESGLIELNLKASVSAPDPTNGVLVSGTQVPALFERQLTSSVTLPPATTVTLAGLLQTQKEHKIYGVPGLRRLPLLGKLFQWRRASFRRTTVVIFVTPSVVAM